MNRRSFLGGAGALAAGLSATGALSSGTAAASGTTRTGYTLHSDLSYAATAGRGHLLDIYVPKGRPGPFPVVIYQAGSGFLSDDTKTRSPGASASSAAPAGLGGITTPASLAQLWAPHGYAIVGLNVRSSSQVHFPGQVHDVKAAIRYLRAHAELYDLDADRFATMGTSSGGWVATMAGVTAGHAELEGSLGHPEQSSAVQAVIDLFGPTDFLQMDAHRLPDGQQHDPADSPESKLMGFPIQTNPAAVRRANPAAYVTGDAAPLFLAHGLSDPIVPHYESELLFAACERTGAHAISTLVPNTGHTDQYLTSPSDSAGRTVKHTHGGHTSTGSQPAPTYDTLRRFLDIHLRIDRTAPPAARFVPSGQSPSGPNPFTGHGHPDR